MNNGRVRRKDSPLVSIIIANYNGGQLLERCLRSLLNTSYSTFEVILVDNASTDGSPDLVAREQPKIQLVRLTTNRGYAAANNIGIGKARGDYVVLLNSDTEVAPDWLGNLVRVAQREKDAAFLQPKILFLDQPDIINSAGNNIHFAGFGVCRGMGARDIGQFEETQRIGYASGACLMVSRRALTTVGPLDEIFFAYGEDKDWGWRARMRGFHSLYVPSSRIYHKGSSVLGWTPRKLYYLELERLVSIWKNHSKRALILLAPLLAITEIAVLTHAMRRRWLSSKIDSYVHAFALRREISKGRSEVFAKKVIPDDVLLREFLYDLWHPYIGRVLIPLNRICRLYKRCIISP